MHAPARPTAIRIANGAERAVEAPYIIPPATTARSNGFPRP